MDHSSVNIRLIASMVDVLIIMAILTPFNNLISYLFSGSNIDEIAQVYVASNAAQGFSVIGFLKYISSQNAVLHYFISQATSLLIAGMYFIIFWKYKSATPGKMLLRIKIVDNNTGEKITLKQSIYRFFGYILSGLLFCIGFIMMHFRKDARGLHDIIASTAVVNEKIILKNKHDRI